MKLRCICFLAICAVGFLSGSRIYAQNDDWYVSAANYARYYHFDSTKVDSAATRFQFDFYMGQFYTGAWFEAKHVMNESGFNFTSNDLSQRYFGWENSGVTVHAGNFYQVFDRGLALNAFRDDDVGIDLVLDGFKADLRSQYFDLDMFSATRGPAGGFSTPIIRGARAKAKPIKMFQIGGAYVSYIETTRTNINQINGRFILDNIDAYIEYAKRNYILIDFIDPNLNERKSGDGTYANVTGYYSCFTGFFEYKNYIYLIYPDIGYLNTPPAVNRQDRLLQAEASNSFQHINGERGFRGNLSIAADEYWGVEFDYSRSYSRGGISMRFDEKFAEIRGNYFSNNVFYINLDKINYSWTVVDTLGKPTFYYRNELKPALEINYDIDDFNGLTLDAFIISYDLPTITDTSDFFADSSDYSEKNISLTYSRAPNLRATIGGSWSNNKASTEPSGMGFLEITCTYKTHDLTVFYGGQRGGLVCSGGVCKYHPTFKGFRVTLLSRL
jgi:hypothetical protein